MLSEYYHIFIIALLITLPFDSLNISFPKNCKPIVTESCGSTQDESFPSQENRIDCDYHLCLLAQSIDDHQYIHIQNLNIRISRESSREHPSITFPFQLFRPPQAT